MLTCPMCKKSLGELSKACPSCRTDLSLLVDYSERMQTGLDRAVAFTRKGELAEAVGAYLEVLEVDPDNPSARRQVGQVAAAVRQFDRQSPGRRWLDALRNEMWATGRKRLVNLLVCVVLLGAGLLLGYYLRPHTSP